MSRIPLPGCTPEPLMSYLKALGILRLVAEQKDPSAKGCWRGGVFVLESALDEDQLVDFLVDEYRPSPIVVPWSGGDFFGVKRTGAEGPYKNTPTSTAIIGAFLASTSPRLASYRTCIQVVLDVMEDTGVTSKSSLDDKKLKSTFIAQLRSSLGDTASFWVDACAVIETDKPSFNPLLGSGGGSDGNTHFSDNFMQNVWEMLADFDVQRLRSSNTREMSSRLLRATMLGDRTALLVPKRTSALFDAGAVGGQNAGQGFERVSLGNPWSFILCLEGSMILAGSIAKRHDATDSGSAAFPFQVRVSSTGRDSAVDKETKGRELWLPLWPKSSSLQELVALFSEGRSSIKRAKARNGVDFARAVSSLGTDRGIAEFSRFAIVRGRVGGDNYNTSTTLGRFSVRFRPDVDLLREVDGWLSVFRRAASDEKAPPRFQKALRRIDAGIFAYCQHGGAERFAEILCALGNAQRELGSAERFRTNKFIRPLHGLTPAWISAIDDSSVELELALALSGIYSGANGPIRAQLDPVDGWKWRENDAAITWSSADLPTNLMAVLERRLLVGDRSDSGSSPLAYRRGASLVAISAFLHGETNDERIDELLHGLVLINQSKGLPPLPHVEREAPPLPRVFGLLKLLFLPRPIYTEVSEVEVKPEVQIVSLLRAGRAAEACAIAARRLRASGLPPIPHTRGGHRDKNWQEAADSLDARRLGASLLIPISRTDAGRLASQITRPQSGSLEAAATWQEA